MAEAGGLRAALCRSKALFPTGDNLPNINRVLLRFHVQKVGRGIPIRGIGWEKAQERKGGRVFSAHSQLLHFDY